MAMMATWYRFPDSLDEATWRAALIAELGAQRASPDNVEVTWRHSMASLRALLLGRPSSIDDDKDSSAVTSIASMDLVALAYATKVSLALGGEPVLPNGSPVTQPRRPAPWTTTPWITKSRWQRLELLVSLRVNDLRALLRRPELPKASVRK